MTPIRVVVVDDSALMRQLISRILAEAGMEVVATARDGLDGLEKVRWHRPDVVTLDVEMPRMNGLSMLRELMAEHPVPVVMLSSLTAEQAPTAVEALALGAVDVVGKPGGGISLNLNAVADELVRKVRAAATARVAPLGRYEPARLAGASRLVEDSRDRTGEAVLVVVGSSTGGPRALTELVSSLPASFPAAMVIVQHMPEGFTASLAARLNGVSELEIAEAVEGRVPTPGEAWVAQGGVHLTFDEKKAMLFDRRAPHLGVRPAVDLTLESAVERWGGRVVSVILTGMGMDGARGSRRVKQAGGVVLAQNEQSSVVYGMPKAVAEMGLADEVLDLRKIPEALFRVVEDLMKEHRSFR